MIDYQEDLYGVEPDNQTKILADLLYRILVAEGIMNPFVVNVPTLIMIGDQFAEFLENNQEEVWNYKNQYDKEGYFV